MALITIDIGNSATRITNAICAVYGYQTTINGSPNPQSKAEFARLKVGEYVKGVVRGYEANIASETARTQAVADVDSQVVIT